jgi:Cysteine-rich CPCC
MSQLWPCPVCGYYVFDAPPGSYEVCDVCDWEDDAIQIRHPRMRGGANGGSIYDYQQRQPTWKPPTELTRDPEWRPLAAEEAALPSGEAGAVDYRLEYYHGADPYYWRSG